MACVNFLCVSTAQHKGAQGCNRALVNECFIRVNLKGKGLRAFQGSVSWELNSRALMGARSDKLYSHTSREWKVVPAHHHSEGKEWVEGWVTAIRGHSDNKNQAYIPTSPDRPTFPNWRSESSTGQAGTSRRPDAWARPKSKEVQVTETLHRLPSPLIPSHWQHSWPKSGQPPQRVTETKTTVEIDPPSVWVSVNISY